MSVHGCYGLWNGPRDTVHEVFRVYLATYLITYLFTTVVKVGEVGSYVHHYTSALPRGGESGYEVTSGAWDIYRSRTKSHLTSNEESTPVVRSTTKNVPGCREEKDCKQSLYMLSNPDVKKKLKYVSNTHTVPDVGTGKYEEPFRHIETRLIVERDSESKC